MNEEHVTAIVIRLLVVAWQIGNVAGRIGELTREIKRRTAPWLDDPGADRKDKGPAGPAPGPGR